MSEFRFKRFSVKNDRSAMKVNTDGVLLGASVILDERPLRVLDAGTGTGTIALMIAQRLEEKGRLDQSSILGIDIDADSAEEAAENFRSSPWNAQMESRHIPLSQCDGIFDLIVSNPPYFDSSLPNPDSRKKLSRHTLPSENESRSDAPLSYRALIDYSEEHLADGGIAVMILPADKELELKRTAASSGLSTIRIMRIKTTPGKDPSRIIVHLKKKSPAGILPTEETLIIQDRGEYTPEYRSIVKDFYLWG